MKRIKFFPALAAAGFISIIFLSGCSNTNDPEENSAINFDSPEFMLIEYSDVSNSIEEATLEKELLFNQLMLNYNFVGGPGQHSANGPGGLKGNGWFDRFDFRKHLGRILFSLNLSDEQKEKIKIFIKEFHESMKPLVKEFYESNKDIIKAANEERKAIIKKVRAGEITRQEAARLIKELNERTKAAIEANPKSLEIKEQMCKLRTSLFSKISAVLTPEQLTKWNEYISKFPAC